MPSFVENCTLLLKRESWFFGQRRLAVSPKSDHYALRSRPSTKRRYGTPYWYCYPVHTKRYASFPIDP